MRVQVDIKELLQSIESFNPGVDLTGLKAYLFDMLIDGVATPVASSVPKVRVTTPLKKTAPLVAVEPVEGPDSPQLDLPFDKYAEDLSPFGPPPGALKGDAMDEDDLEGEMGSGFDSESVESLAKKAIGSVSPGTPQLKRGGPARKTPQEKFADREAKRKARVDFSKMTAKEVMQHMTDAAQPKKPEGQNQFLDLGEEE